jgi:hypothetical protein
MNLDPMYLLASLLVSGVGYVLFSYGRKQHRLPHTGVGVVMLIYPYFITEVVWMLAVLPVLLLVLWLLVQLGL